MEINLGKLRYGSQSIKMDGMDILFKILFPEK
jgi:hypothetical protein